MVSLSQLHVSKRMSVNTSDVLRVHLIKPLCGEPISYLKVSNNSGFGSLCYSYRAPHMIFVAVRYQDVIGLQALDVDGRHRVVFDERIYQNICSIKL